MNQVYGSLERLSNSGYISFEESPLDATSINNNRRLFAYPNFETALRIREDNIHLVPEFDTSYIGKIFKKGTDYFIGTVKLNEETKLPEFQMLQAETLSELETGSTINFSNIQTIWNSDSNIEEFDLVGEIIYQKKHRNEAPVPWPITFEASVSDHLVVVKLPTHYYEHYL